ncbi:30S ribosomal protein S27ae [Candidatus Woesearchaeota archaeon]|nr:30S ribosomal protein S27ae [Candidatus Woesearchaeota archaeon]
MAKPRKREKKHINRKPVKIHTIFEGSKSKNKSCPKCGLGVFMANHKDRWTCGKCSYTEFKTQK